MSGEAWFTLAVVLVLVIVLVRELLPPSAAFLGALVAVLVAEIIEPEQAFSGFANPAPITIAAVYVLARGVEKSGALTPLVNAALRSGSSDWAALARMSLPTAAASAFMNNTPIVAILTPQIERWAEAERRSVSTFLMPLSFAAILGGLVTVIGTATNLVVSGLFEASGMEPMGFFEISKVGVPMAVAGLVTMIALAPVVLPRRRSAAQEAVEELRRFSIDMTVDAGGPLDGVDVAGAGLRDLAGMFLAEVERAGDVAAPVSPETVLRGGDQLRFYGRADQILDLQNRRGLSRAANDQLAALDTGRAAYFEAVIGASSPIVGRTLKEAGFRERYQAAVIAIHRAGQRIDRQIGGVRLRAGDTLLLVADPGFGDRWRSANHFLLVAPLGGAAPPGPRRVGRLLAVGVAVVGLAATGVTPLVTAVLLGTVGLVLFGVLTPGEARDAVNLDVIVMIAAAIGFATAMEDSGLAGEIASGVVSLFGDLGDLGVLIGVVLATTLLKEVITNNAAALLIFPVAISTALSLGLDPRAFGMAVAVAAASSFLTPIGYQTNIMVYGPGGYHFTDYLRLGAPMTVVTLTVAVVLIPISWPL